MFHFVKRWCDFKSVSASSPWGGARFHRYERFKKKRILECRFPNTRIQAQYNCFGFTSSSFEVSNNAGVFHVESPECGEIWVLRSSTLLIAQEEIREALEKFCYFIFCERNLCCSVHRGQISLLLCRFPNVLPFANRNAGDLCHWFPQPLEVWLRPS